MQPARCHFGGCQRPARWECRKLFGDRRAFHTCDQHKPDPANRPAALRHLPFAYIVKPS